MMDKTRILAVVGPTASGKTALSVELAKALNGEIVSADSMQIYKNMPIASAVPDINERQGVRHYLMEVLEPDQKCTVASYVKMAHKAIKDIADLKKQPIVVGGTGLYINSLLSNILFTDEQENLVLRKSLEAEFIKNGGKAMLERLKCIDPQAAIKLNENDRTRIIRAIEIFENTGVTKSEADRRSRLAENIYECTYIGLAFKDREKLYERINKRIDIMFENGLIEEARTAFFRNSEGGAVQAIGHKELFPYFSGEKSLEECIEILKRETRRYAKRQLTWFKRNESINWIFMDECENPVKVAKKIFEREQNNEQKQNV